MKIKRKDGLVTYSPRGHYNMLAQRVHSADTTGTRQLTIGLSKFQPGGGAETSIVPEGMELVYYIIDGEMELTTPETKTVLTKGDSALFQAGDERAVRNISGESASMLVIAAKLPQE